MSYAVIEKKKRSFWNRVETSFTCDEMRLKVPEGKEKQQIRYAKKVDAVFKKYKVNRAVLSKDCSTWKTFQNKLQENSHDIITGKKMYLVLLPRVLEDVSRFLKFERERMNVAILVDEYCADHMEVIQRICEEVKQVTIVTNHAYRFEQIIEELLRSQGIVVQLASQKQANWKRKQVIINLDFSPDRLEKLNVPKDCVVITNTSEPQALREGFNGIVIREIDIALGNECEAFRSIDLCEAYLYQSMKRLKENEKLFQQSSFRINGYLGNHGKIAQEDFERLGEILRSSSKQNVKKKLDKSIKND